MKSTDDMAAYRAAVEAGYAPLADYVEAMRGCHQPGNHANGPVPDKAPAGPKSEVLECKNPTSSKPD